jgi:hypothetical protein
MDRYMNKVQVYILRAVCVRMYVKTPIYLGFSMHCDYLYP